ncbi:MAG: hypothetical protein QOJ64_1837 [Acidobacteriota bacterium]|nr:hypothetical protein [Acidobacteriota bacterium]
MAGLVIQMKLKFPLLIRASATAAFALATLALIAGCNKEPDTGNSREAAPSKNPPASAPPRANTPSTANTSPSTSIPTGPSPTEVVKGYYEAGKRKDVAGIKRFLSRQSLQLMEDVANRQGKTLDQLFIEAADMEARKPAPLIWNERIGGDTALVDIKTPGEPMRTVPLVKEAGEWRLAFGNPKGGAVKH